MSFAAWGRRASGFCIVLLAVVLPALAAGASLDAEVEPGEWERLQAAVSANRPTFAEMFLGWNAMPVADSATVGAEEVARHVGEARLAQVFGLLACSMLGYMVCMLANGRASALLATLCFCALPPIATDGHVLRAETAVVMLQLLALLLVQLLAMAQLPAAATIRRASGVALGATAAACVGLAVASMPTMGGVLLFPSGLAILAAILVGQRLWRALRRRSVAVWPARAATRRLWPFAWFAMLSLLASAMLLVESRRPVGAGPVPQSGSLLPDAMPLAVSLVALAGLGATRTLVRAGRRLGLRGRIGPDAALLAYAAAALVHRGIHGAESDALVAALPFAWLLAEGSTHAFLLVAAWLRRDAKR